MIIVVIFFVFPPGEDYLRVEKGHPEHYLARSTLHRFEVYALHFMFPLNMHRHLVHTHTYSY